VEENERYTLAEAAALTGLTPQALARRIERGSLPAVKIGGRRFVSLQDLAGAGLVDPATKARPSWSSGNLDSGALAREIVAELNARGFRILELERRLDELTARAEDQQRQLDQAKRERAELRREIGRLTKRSP
jgi:excisionase family DNA binding protein